jgi:hypothetical protein
MEKLPEKAAGIAAKALYEGAGVAADAVSQAVQGIATEPFKYASRGKTRKPSPEEKAIVAGAKHGVAKFRKTGNNIQTSVGFQNSGYGTIKGKSKPIPQIANAINSGTSFMQKQPFLRKAFSQSKGAAVAAIEAGIQKRLEELEI